MVWNLSTVWFFEATSKQIMFELIFFFFFLIGWVITSILSTYAYISCASTWNRHYNSFYWNKNVSFYLIQVHTLYPPYIIRQFAHPIPIATPLLTSVAAPLLTLWLWSYPNVALSISSHLVGVMYRFHLEFSREIYSVGSYRFHSQVLNYKFFIMYLLSPEVILKKLEHWQNSRATWPDDKWPTAPGSRGKSDRSYGCLSCR